MPGGMLERLSCVLLVLCFCCQLTDTAQILAILPYTFSTPFMLVTPYLQALRDKGHDLTVISPLKGLAELEGIRHIHVRTLDKLSEETEDWDPEIANSKWKEASMVSEFFNKLAKAILQDDQVQVLLHNKTQHFDMVILEADQLDALYGFAPRFNALLVGIATFGGSWNIDYMAGNSAPSVYEPRSPVGYTHGNTILKKWRTWLFITEEWLLDRLVFLPPQVKLYRRYFNFSAESLYKLRSNFSLILINQHFSLGRARSNVPNLIEVAGMHMKLNNTLIDEQLQRFLDEAEDDVIVFSMGNEIWSKLLPKGLQQVLLSAFSQLKQRVIWKYELTTLPNKSDNIYTTTWLPQLELLAHPKVKLFISQCGLLSIIEAVYMGVPVLGLPLLFDQFGNAERMEQAGGALTLDLNRLSAQQLIETINELLHNPQYAHSAQQMSARFRDQPMAPLQTAIWWTEYVLRHKGASHMRLDEQAMSFMQYYNLDILSLLFGRIGLAFMIVICVCLKLANIVLVPSHIGLNVS